MLLDPHDPDARPDDRLPPDHVALPESWGWTPRTKIYISGVLVVAMAGLALAATVLTIKQQASGLQSCVDVAP